MPYEIPTVEPTRLVAGDNWNWDKAVPEFSAADGWQLAYRLSGPTDLDIPFGSLVTASGNGFQIRIPKTSTQGLTPGTYLLVGFVSKGSERYTLEDCWGSPVRIVVTVLANPTTTVNALTPDETMLAAIDAALSGRLTSDQEEITINGRSIKFIPFEQLMKLQDVYRQRVINARAPGQALQEIEVGFLAPR